MFGDVFSPRTKACKRTADDCYNVKPHLHKTQCYTPVLLPNQSPSSIVEEIIMFLFVGFGVVEFYNMSTCKTYGHKIKCLTRKKIVKLCTVLKKVF